MTVIGGLLFLVPLMIIYFVADKAIDLISPVTYPVVQKLGLERMLGFPGRIVLGLIALAVLAFAIGMFARTRAGQALLHWLQQGIAIALPQFAMFQTFANSLNKESETSMPVVLVATDAGWQLGILLAEPEHGWYPVFLPGAPQLTSGSISYAQREFIHDIDLTTSELWSILRSRGGFSVKVCKKLAELQAEGKLEARP
jgi:uncharacterized membrane protein